MTPGRGATRDREARLRDDADARALAQREFARPLLLEAGAGTGKTSVLVARVVAWCLGRGWERARTALAGGLEAPSDDEVAARVLDRVVAITFTEAAAAEMAERVARALRALTDASGEEPWPHGLDPEALPPPEARRARARALVSGLDRLRVSTIHAFCRRLLAEHPIEAGVHPRFAVDARGLARASAAREAVEAWLSDPARADDVDLVDLVDDGIAAPELESMLDALLAAAPSPEAFAADPLSRERILAFVARLRAAVDDLLAAASGCLDGLPDRAVGRRVAEAVAGSRSVLSAAAPDPAALVRLLAALAEVWPQNARTRLREWAQGTFKAHVERDAIADCREGFVAAAACLDPLIAHALALDPPRLARVHRVLAPLHARAAARMTREGHESFDALLRRTRALLDRHDSVTDAVRGRIDQLLVDEFQDTDSAQCAIVARLAFEGEGRPGLFVVGDPKQSIYGWRNADLAAYERFRARLRAAGGTVNRLSVNHRSVAPVLDEVERTIGPVMREVAGAQPRFEPLLPDPAIAEPRGAGPVVEHWVASDWSDLEGLGTGGGAAKTRLSRATEREAARLAADLLRLAREGGESWRWENAGILFRSTGDLEVYLEALRHAGIPYTVARDRRYQRRREVVEARALVRAVLDPSDQIALVAALRSAWAGVPDAAWRPLWRRGFPEAVRAVFDDAPGAGERLAGVVRSAGEDLRVVAGAVPGLDRLAGWEDGCLHAVDVLAALRRSFARETAERWVERLRTLPLLEATEAARFLGPWRLANLERFFRELGAAFEDALGDPTEVLRVLRRDEALDADWDEGRAQQPSEDAVQVMTIHGAKGLQFEHVYVVQLHKGRGRGDDESFRAGAEALAGEWCFGSVRVATLGFDLVSAERRRIEAHELVRTLYVAMTRAERRLVLAGHWSPRATRGAHGALVAAARGEEQVAAIEGGLEAGERWDGVVDRGRIRWVFLDRAAVPEGGRGRSRASAAAIDPERARADASHLRVCAERAARRAGRPFVAAATAALASEWREGRAAAGEGGEDRVQPWRPAPAEIAVAAAVGTAVHAVLERFDWGEDEARAWERAHAHLRAALARRLDAAQQEHALSRALELLERLAGGPLWERLRRLAPDVVARELPVLVAPEADAGPVGAVVGTLDLLYRDPDTREWVVADFKTDRVEREEAIREKLDRYRSQGRTYQRAVQQALALDEPPRFELWFLGANRIARLEG